MGSAQGVPDDKLRAAVNVDAPDNPLFTEAERLAFAYADAMSYTDRDVDDALFARLRAAFTDDELVELTAVVAWENASARFNRALRIPAQGLWKPGDE